MGNEVTVSKPKCLITGGAGFIGSNLSNFIQEIGWDLDIVDDLSSGKKEFLNVELRSERLWVEDFCSPEVLERISRKTYDFVFHLAANPRVGYSVSNPVESNDINVTKSLMLVDACRDNVSKFIFASSSAIYGESKNLPTLESEIPNPKSPYALQKLIIENYLKLYSDLYGLDSICLRFFNVCGPNQLGNSAYSTAVSAWLTALFSGLVLRSDGDGTQTRDMVFVQDVVRALAKSAVTKTCGCEILNIGTGVSISNNDILDLIRYKYDTILVNQAPARVGDVKHTLSSIERAGSLIGYEPKYDFMHGFKETFRWYDSNWEWLRKIL